MDINTQGINLYKHYAQIDRINSFLTDNTKVTKTPEAQKLKKTLAIDFASESASFSKLNILAQSGSFYLSQKQINHQNVMRLIH